MKRCWILLLAACVAACSSSLTREDYLQFTQVGDDAMGDGRPDLAEDAYTRAAYEVDWGALSSAEKAASRFNLANAKVRMGKYADAEPLLLESLVLYENLSGPGYRFAVKRYFGLAIVYFEAGKHDQGLDYLRKTEPLARDAEFAVLAKTAYGRYADWLDAQDRSAEAAFLRKIVH